MTKISDTPRKVEKSMASRGKEPEIEGSSDEEYPTDLEDQPCIPLIFVMRVSGAGKSSFIKTLGGEDSEMKPPETSATESVTREVGVYKTVLDGQEMPLIDTPGFKDNKTSNLETLQKICEYILQAANNPACVIHGVVYIHNIATSRWIASDQRTWSILKALCGDAAMSNVIVATTRWPENHEEEDFESLEKRNLKNYWEGILGTVRLAKNDVRNSRTVILTLLGIHPKTFQVQRELRNGNTPSDTSAGRISIIEGEEALSKMEKEKEYALAELARVSSQIEPVQPQSAPKLPQPPPSPPDSARRISTTEGEEVLSKAEKDARGEIGRISSRVKPMQSRDTQKLTQQPLPETEGPSAANIEEGMGILLQRLESAIQANKSQLEKIKDSEETLQEEIQQVLASLKEKEGLLKKYHQLRRKIESADELKARLNASRTPISTWKISRKEILAMALAGSTVVLNIGSMDFTFYGFAACGGVLLYQGVKQMMLGNANCTPKDSQPSQTSDTERQTPTTNIGEGVGLNDRGSGDGGADSGSKGADEGVEDEDDGGEGKAGTTRAAAADGAEKI